MSTILAARYHQGTPQAIVMDGNGKRRGQRKYMSDEFIPQDKCFKRIAGRNFGKSTNNRTYGNSGAKIAPCFSSSIKVRHQNKDHVHHQIGDLEIVSLLFYEQVLI